MTFPITRIVGALYAKMPYDMVRDFAPVTLLATTTDRDLFPYKR